MILDAKSNIKHLNRAMTRVNSSEENDLTSDSSTLSVGATYGNDEITELQGIDKM